MELFPPLCLSSSFFFDLFSIYFAIFIRGMEEDILEWKIYGDFTAGFIMEDLFRNAVDIICDLSSLVIVLFRE